MAKTAKPTGIVALVGLDYRTPSGDVRVEAGEACDDAPEAAMKWLKAQGLITTGDATPVVDAAAEGEQA